MDSLAAARVPRSEVRIWTAHYTGKEHRCSSACGHGSTGADAALHTHRTIDVSHTSGSFWD